MDTWASVKEGGTKKTWGAAMEINNHSNDGFAI